MSMHDGDNRSFYHLHYSTRTVRYIKIPYLLLNHSSYSRSKVNLSVGQENISVNKFYKTPPSLARSFAMFDSSPVQFGWSDPLGRTIVHLCSSRKTSFSLVSTKSFSTSSSFCDVAEIRFFGLLLQFLYTF